VVFILFLSSATICQIKASSHNLLCVEYYSVLCPINTELFVAHLKSVQISHSSHRESPSYRTFTGYPMHPFSQQQQMCYFHFISLSCFQLIARNANITICLTISMTNRQYFTKIHTSSGKHEENITYLFADQAVANLLQTQIT